MLRNEQENKAEIRTTRATTNRSKNKDSLNYDFRCKRLANRIEYKSEGKTNRAKKSQQIDKKENKGIGAGRHKGDSQADKANEMVVVDDSKKMESRKLTEKIYGYNARQMIYRHNTRQN